MRICDSLHYPTSLSVKKTIADLLHTKEEVIIIEIMNVHLQKGGDDCGLFAIAMATTLCNGGNPVDMVYDQGKMRDHLITAFKRNQLLPFPSSTRKRRGRQVIQMEELPVFCVCRMPDDGRLMIECSTCKKWYHNNCVHISKNAL